MPIKLLARKNVQELTPYLSARRIGGQGDVWLNANEYPAAPDYELTQKNFNRYPECQPTELIKRYADYADILPTQVLATRGADEGIELLMRTFCEPERDAILFCPPTYGMYRVSAETLGIEIKTIVTNSDFSLNLSNIEAQLTNVKLIYVCHPNNPTGNLASVESIKHLLALAAGQALVVIDEAYIEFSDKDTVVSLLKDYPHLVILRTLSKAFALAGLRCGFVLANAPVIELLLKVIAPYPIALPVADIATQALAPENIVEMRRNVQMIIHVREAFKRQLCALKCVDHIFESSSNYLLVRFNDAAAVFSFLGKSGIVVRDQSSQLHLANCMRITIGSEIECTRVITALNQFDQQETRDIKGAK